MKKRDLMTVFFGATLLIGVGYGLKTGWGWRYYPFLLVLACCAGFIGHELGKEEETV